MDRRSILKSAAALALLALPDVKPVAKVEQIPNS